MSRPPPPSSAVLDAWADDLAKKHAHGMGPAETEYYRQAMRLIARQVEALERRNAVLERFRAELIGEAEEEDQKHVEAEPDRDEIEHPAALSELAMIIAEQRATAKTRRGGAA